MSRTVERLQQPDILFEPRLCSRVRWHSSRCDRCVQACAFGALQLAPQTKVDESRCTGCGVCISACPNGAFWSRTRADTNLLSAVASLPAGAVVTYACVRSGPAGKNTVLLSCLGRLTENLLLAPLAHGAGRVLIRQPLCQGCVYEKALTHLDAVLFLGRKLASMVGREEECIEVIKEDPRPPLGSQRAPHLSRREFFRHLQASAAQAMSAFLPEFGTEVRDDRWVHLIGAKRAYLLKLLRSFPVRTSACIERDGMPLGQARVSVDCSGCSVCITLCPTGALQRVEGSNEADMYFRPDICTGCQICQEACLFRAISLLPAFDLADLATGEARHIVHLYQEQCTECTADFLGAGVSTCPACRAKRLFTCTAQDHIAT